MPSKGLFYQNVVAVVWDFDRTLSPHYMQRPLFEAYGIDEGAFWKEVNALPAFYRKAGIHVALDTCYLGHLLSYVREGRLEGLTNARLGELGAGIAFFPGVPGVFERLQAILAEPDFANTDLRLEHYVVSTGLAAMIRGSAIADRLDGVYASEFIETPAGPDYDPQGAPKPGVISQIAYFLDNTTKTRALFEINKGTNVERSITVNEMIPEEERRVPFRNMIYVADGPSDIPSFSVVRKHGGRTYAVYNSSDPAQFKQCVSLQESGRVEAYGPADYQAGTPTSMWLELQVRRIAERIVRERKQVLESKMGKEPEHLHGDAAGT